MSDPNAAGGPIDDYDPLPMEDAPLHLVASHTLASDGPASAVAFRSGRIAAIDWMRGLVMLLMVVDHASLMWNPGRVAADSAYLRDPVTGAPLWTPGASLDWLQFTTRWITHLCAPTFLFLSGTSLAISLERRRGRGASSFELDRHLFIRALVLFACEGLISMMPGHDGLHLQVLFAIGASMLAMIPLRRLPASFLLALGLAWLAGSEFVLFRFFPIGNEATAVSRSLARLLFFVPGRSGSIFVQYPMTHWLGMMILGWAFGRFLLARPANENGRLDIEKLLLLSGLSSLLLWAFVRRNNGYGNMGLLRDDTTIVQWLHMSRYPPSLSFSMMELGLMALLLVVFLRHERRMSGPPREFNPLLVFGQTALFFYVVHFIVLGAGVAILRGESDPGGLSATWLATGAALVVLYPICLGYRALKRRFPRSALQYL
ncbi:MAG TPA: DUF1624 domain-containing protein [Deltaproteobacteria bacterium]|nr:DUF1624 domain-containing protein [Deltaproteobacteria bacterium]